MALSLCRTTVDDSARELMEHGTAAFPIACYHDDLQAEPTRRRGISYAVFCLKKKNHPDSFYHPQYQL